MTPPYAQSVFINCPFDKEYAPLFRALVFVVHDCGFIARCAWELQNTAPARISRIVLLVRECRFGIHDISRTELDSTTGLPRFNMPLELGIFLGAREFGDPQQRDKVCLVLDRDRYRYQQFCSDIAGQDPSSHNSDPLVAVRVVRDWLRTHTLNRLPSAERMADRYAQFLAALPVLCEQAQLEEGTMTFVDYAALVVEWLKENPFLIPSAPISSGRKRKRKPPVHRRRRRAR